MGREAPPELLAQAPEWFMYIRAAERLGCSVFDLLDHPDASFWMNAAASASEFENWAQEREMKRR